ncbi:hypothetical protein [Roseateles saccharophilus]|uniref:Uncharacterized protein n=1 Tax=Roseateles saccharophilus TaxID=304 RepID=A0A4R3V5Z5_ROSSA|nr:hypothetical protein [Roseateles saccharophilus]MDG0833743.1 hypothetical protein [Roseateles saccharophilus]TCU98823.1 hypothetical protein EV671_100999 [Roseateles saccharophilus]
MHPPQLGPRVGDRQALVIAGHFPNSQAPGCDEFVYKFGWLDALDGWVGGQMKSHEQFVLIVLMDDANIVPEGRDFYDPIALTGQIHHTPKEHAQFQQLVGLRHLEQPPHSWTWRGYRNLASTGNQDLRTDHILVSGAEGPRDG